RATDASPAGPDHPTDAAHARVGDPSGSGAADRGRLPHALRPEVSAPSATLRGSRLHTILAYTGSVGLRNVTITLDEDAARWARIRAADPDRRAGARGRMAHAGPSPALVVGLPDRRGGRACGVRIPAHRGSATRLAAGLSPGRQPVSRFTGN